MAMLALCRIEMWAQIRRHPAGRLKAGLDLTGSEKSSERGVRNRAGSHAFVTTNKLHWSKAAPVLAPGFAQKRFYSRDFFFDRFVIRSGQFPRSGSASSIVRLGRPIDLRNRAVLDDQWPWRNEAGDFPAVEGITCRGQAMGATLPLGFLLSVDQAAKCATQVGIFQHLTDVGHPAARQVDLS